MKQNYLFLLAAVLCGANVAYGAIIPPASSSTPKAETSTQPNGKGVKSLSGELTLEDCIEIALANSPRVVSAQLELQSAQVNVNLARSEFLPTASVGASQGYNVSKREGSSTRTDHGSSNAYAQAQLTISGVTDIARNVRIQKLSLEKAQLNLNSVKNEIIRNVRKHYYALLSASRAVAIRTQSRDLYKDQYERASEYYKQGLYPKVDVTTSEVNLNNEELRLIRAKNLVKTASATLANAMGVTTPDLLQIAEVEFAKFDIPFKEAVETAYSNRPDVESARLNVRIGQLSLNKAKSGFLPTFSFSAGYNRYDDDFYMDNEETKLMASVDLPIFNAFKTYNNYKQAKISLDNTLNSNRSLLNDVFLEVQNAYIQMEEAAESVPIAQLNVEKAKENLELAQGRYNEGIGDVIELKDAEVAYTDAELSLLTARYDYASAVADLKQAMGTY